MVFRTAGSRHGSAAAQYLLASRAPGARLSKHGQHVVIVESYEDAREFYEQWFTFAGYRASSFATAAEARDAIARERPDVVIASLHPRGEDALSFCQELKKRARTADTPLIALTSSMAGFDRARSLGSFAAIMMIPCPPDGLLAVVERVLAGSQCAVHLSA